jgi:hypothetical protein
MIVRALALSAGLAALLPAEAVAQLVRQEVVGIYRVCTYRTPLEDRQKSVRSHQTCPASLTEAERVERPKRIPSFAMLKRQELTDDGRKACIYEDAGREYRRLVSATGYCSLTPTSQAESETPKRR